MPLDLVVDVDGSVNVLHSNPALGEPPSRSFAVVDCGGAQHVNLMPIRVRGSEDCNASHWLICQCNGRVAKHSMLYFGGVMRCRRHVF